MWLRLTFLTVILTAVFSADHDLFKDCSRVDFCTNLRTNFPDDNTKYHLNTDSLRIDGGDAFVDLVNNAGKTLNLQVSALNNDIFRLQINENGNDRYRLVDVLAETPQTNNIDRHDVTDSGIILAVNADSTSRVEIVKEPLSINIYKNDQLEIVLNGDRIRFENSETSQAFTFSVAFPQGAKIYGLHEHAEHLALQNTGPGGVEPYRLKNSDNYAYDVYSPMAIYGAVPTIYGHGTQATAGIFLHNAAQQWVDISTADGGSSAYFMVESGSLDIFTLPGPTPTDVVRQYVSITGRAHLPQWWVLGYHQSRYNYVSQDDVKDVIANMDSHNFPMDVIWLDIDYTDGKKYFTWDPVNFGNPTEMQANISSTNRKLVTIIDPHIKVDSSYSVYQNAADRQLFVKNADGSNFEGNCWPGLSSYLDFSNPDARDYYASLFHFENFPGSTETLAGIWNDMNEPSVFDARDVENTLPPTALHLGNVPHRDLHNAYGFLQTKATHQGLIERDNNQKRPFVLTRSTFAGSQRYTAFWTGDAGADWNYLAVSIPMCLNANILGIVLCGADVGGFLNNPTDELFQRWYQAGAWIPFYRAHSEKSTNRREPYLFSDDVQRVVRDAMNLRYNHLPVWYTLFYEHTRVGDPLIRPLFYQYPDNPAVFEIDFEMLVGPNILVRPVVESNVQSVHVYFPEENAIWFQLNSDAYFQGQTEADIPVDISFIPIYYKSGSIIPRKDTLRRSATDMINDSYNLHVNLDQNGQASGTLYIDDLESFEYDTNKIYSYVNLSWDGNTVQITPIDGQANPDQFPITIDQVIVRQVNGKDNSGRYETVTYGKTVDGQRLKDIVIDTTNSIKLQLL